MVGSICIAGVGNLCGLWIMKYRTVENVYTELLVRKDNFYDNLIHFVPSTGWRLLM